MTITVEDFLRRYANVPLAKRDEKIRYHPVTLNQLYYLISYQRDTITYMEKAIEDNLKVAEKGLEQFEAK